MPPADADDFEVLSGGPPKRRSPESGTHKRDWSAAEDLLAFAVVCRCGSDRAYRAACVSLCRLLDRAPAMTSRQTTVEDESVHLVERRTVTNGSRESAWNRHLIPLAKEVFAGFRTGDRLTWGERVKLLQPLHRQGLKGTPTKTVEDLMLLTDRRSHDDDGPRRYLARLVGVTRSKADVEDEDAGLVLCLDTPGLRLVSERVVGPWLESPTREHWRAVRKYLDDGDLPDAPDTVIVPANPTADVLFGKSFGPRDDSLLDPGGDTADKGRRALQNAFDRGLRLPTSDDDLPESHVPAALRPPAPKPRDRVEYAVGRENDQPHSYGMIAGPWPTLQEALDFVPARHDDGGHPITRRAFLFRFNRDGTDDVLYVFNTLKTPACWDRWRPRS